MKLLDVGIARLSLFVLTVSLTAIELITTTTILEVIAVSSVSI